MKEMAGYFAPGDTFAHVRPFFETIPERGQTACLLKEEHLAVLSAVGETLLNQAFSLPTFWNGLAFNRINHRWVDFSNASSPLYYYYLQRRNFTRIPWQTGHPSDSTIPAWVTADLGNVRLYYTYTHTMGRTIPQSSFPAEVTAIRADAASRYGSDYDKP